MNATTTTTDRLLDSRFMMCALTFFVVATGNASTQELTIETDFSGVRVLHTGSPMFESPNRDIVKYQSPIPFRADYNSSPILSGQIPYIKFILHDGIATSASINLAPASTDGEVRFAVLPEMAESAGIRLMAFQPGGLGNSHPVLSAESSAPVQELLLDISGAINEHIPISPDAVLNAWEDGIESVADSLVDSAVQPNTQQLMTVYQLTPIEINSFSDTLKQQLAQQLQAASDVAVNAMIDLDRPSRFLRFGTSDPMEQPTIDTVNLIPAVLNQAVPQNPSDEWVRDKFRLHFDFDDDSVLLSEFIELLNGQSVNGSSISEQINVGASYSLNANFYDQNGWHVSGTLSAGVQDVSLASPGKLAAGGYVNVRHDCPWSASLFSQITAGSSREYGLGGAGLSPFVHSATIHLGRDFGP